jgi:predicted lactoylglutathione lyase
MATKIFVNLPVKNLDGSITFFKNLGYFHNPQFTDDTAACIVISEDIYAMLLTHEKFKEFTKKEISDSSKNSEVIIALSADSKEKVNETVDKAIKAGGIEPVEAKDYGFMFQRSFQDLDGHLWEVVWMDLAAINQN